MFQAHQVTSKILEEMRDNSPNKKAKELNLLKCDGFKDDRSVSEYVAQIPWVNIVVGHGPEYSMTANH